MTMMAMENTRYLYSVEERYAMGDGMGLHKGNVVIYETCYFVIARR